MKFSEFKKYFSVFVLAVAVIAVYKTFDNIAEIFSAVGAFFSILTPILYAFVIAFLLYPLCVKTEKFISTKMPEFFRKRARGISVLSVYIFVFLIVGSIVSLLMPALLKSVVDFLKMIPQLVQDMVESINESTYFYIDSKNISKIFDFQKLLAENGWLNMSIYTSKILSISVNFVNIILSIITSIYILIDRKSLLKAARTVIRLIGKKYKFDFFKKYGKRAIEFSYKYIFCVLVDALIIFVISLIILLIMGIEYAPVLALMLGVFNLVPYFGAIIACIVSVLITMMTASFSKAIILAVILFALQQVDCNVIQPHLIEDRLEVKPFWVLAGILIGGGLFGIWGIVLAIPFMALLKTIIGDYITYKAENSNK